MILYLYANHNYYNRIVKRYETIDEYGVPLSIFTGINFVYADGIHTTQIVNYSGGVHPEYLVVCDEASTILSRWFVVESTETRQGQYNLSLYRDVIADWYDEVINAPTFIEKASLTQDNPLIYNKEDMSFNQIKTQEILLKDQSECPWIVGYVDRGFVKAGNDKLIVEPTKTSAAYTYETMEQFQSLYPLRNYYGSGNFRLNQTSIFRLNWYNVSSIGTTGNKAYCFAWDENGEPIQPFSPNSITGQYETTGIYYKKNGAAVGYVGGVASHQMTMVGESAIAQAKKQDWYEDSRKGTYHPDTLLYSQYYNQLAFENGKKVKIGNQLYKLQFSSPDSDASPIINNVPVDSGLGLKMQRIAKYFGWLTTDSGAKEPFFQIEAMVQPYTLKLVEIESEDLQIEIADQRVHCSNLPYDVFCIPYGEIQIGTNAANVSRADYGMQLANAIIRATVSGSGSNLYDIQLLPYCPLQGRLSGKKLTVNTNNGDRTLYKGDKYYSAIYWVDEADFELTIDLGISIPDTPTELKVANDCDEYRLVSPNYNGQFEFSAVRNNGVSAFVADCSYKPYQPYIKISPLFGGLYGKDFDDARGLICGGDFSLTQADEAWTTYQLQNKNYQVMFDREIESLDVQQDAARKLQKWEIATGALTATMQGGMTGAMMGGGTGAAAGAAVYGGVSLAAGIADYKIQETLRNEARDYRIDQFGYQLGNIKALPTSITKVSSLNKNNKYFPFLEYYTCTDIEKEALRNKIKYNGMTVMTIGTISQYQQETPTYIKGRLIRLEGVNESSHVINTIANELNKGVFI